MFKSKNLIVLVIVLVFFMVAFNINGASAGKPFNLILKKLNKIIHILEENLLPVPCEPVPCDPVPCIDFSQVPKTGQTTFYASGDDGDLQKGFTWPTPRFTDNNDGTVTDNLTELVWLKDADCFTGTWADALTFCNTLASGSCGLSDGSLAGDWRLPNIKELNSLVHYGFLMIPNTSGTGPWTDGDPFTNVQGYWYWTSTAYADSPFNYAWHLNMSHGHALHADKNNALPVWPVRGGN